MAWAMARAITLVPAALGPMVKEGPEEWAVVRSGSASSLNYNF